MDISATRDLASTIAKQLAADDRREARRRRAQRAQHEHAQREQQLADGARGMPMIRKTQPASEAHSFTSQRGRSISPGGVGGESPGWHRTRSQDETELSNEERLEVSSTDSDEAFTVQHTTADSIEVCPAADGRPETSDRSPERRPRAKHPADSADSFPRVSAATEVGASSNVFRVSARTVSSSTKSALDRPLTPPSDVASSDGAEVNDSTVPSSATGSRTTTTGITGTSHTGLTSAAAARHHAALYTDVANTESAPSGHESFDDVDGLGYVHIDDSATSDAAAYAAYRAHAAAAAGAP